MLWFGTAQAQNQTVSCDNTGIGVVQLDAEGTAARILSVSAATEGTIKYCLVKVLVPKAINIWVGLPMDGAWNGRWQSVGGGVYAGAVDVPLEAIKSGFAAATTDTGHAGGRADMPVPFLDGSFAMLKPGEANLEAIKDFAYRSEHLMAVIGKQLVHAFYGQDAKYSYWNGCSTGGRQGLRLAQDYPDDYNGILAGAPAIHWDRFQAAMLWTPMLQLHSGAVGGGNPATMAAKYKLATNKAVAACDVLDGVSDGVIDDPRRCSYSAAKDNGLTTAACLSSDTTCLMASEATVIDQMWQGPVVCSNDKAATCKAPEVASRNLNSKGPLRLWYGAPRGTDLTALGGAMPFPVVIEQARYWIYLDPNWDWKQVDRSNFLQFFKDNVSKVGSLMASDNPDLSAFHQHGGKLVLWHGWSDQLINARGTIDYYERVASKSGGIARAQEFARLFMAPGVAHCAGGNGPQPQRPLDAVINWVEKGVAPETIFASKSISSGAQTRPLCAYPKRAKWNGKGSSDDAASFTCEAR